MPLLAAQDRRLGAYSSEGNGIRASEKRRWRARSDRDVSDPSIHCQSGSKTLERAIELRYRAANDIRASFRFCQAHTAGASRPKETEGYIDASFQSSKGYQQFQMF
jgi:hypothetical protein